MVLAENNTGPLLNGIVCDTESGVYVANDDEVSTTSCWVLIRHTDVSQTSNTKNIILRFIAIPHPITATETRYEMCISAVINTTDPTDQRLLNVTKLTRMKICNNIPVSYNCYGNLDDAHKREIAGYPSFRSKTLGYCDTVPECMLPVYRSLKRYLIHIEHNV